MGRFKQKVVVVTGASAGLGRAIVREFAKRGCAVGLIARNEDALMRAAEEVRSLGGKALVLPLDVADPDAIEMAADRIEGHFGPIDVWVNNAMVSIFSPVLQMTPSEFRRVTEVTYLGYVYGTISALKRMVPRDSGTIIQIGSALAYRAIPLQSAYCAAKHAIKGFTESLRCELLHDGSNVKLCMVQMPALNTPQFSWVKSRLPRQPQPVPPIFQPEVGARAVLWTAEHKPRELLVGYPTMKAIFAEKFAPDFADHYLAESGYESQQTHELASPDRPNNLWQPVAGDWDSRGHFDEQAKSFSPALWMVTHKGIVLGLFAGISVLLLKRGRNRLRNLA